jgi:hypothetical protein
MSSTTITTGTKRRASKKSAAATAAGDGNADDDADQQQQQEKLAPALAALTYCHQRSPDMVAANLLANGADVAAALDGVYQAFQPLMLLTRGVVACHQERNKHEPPADYIADDVANALAGGELGVIKFESEMLRHANAHLKVTDVELIALLANSDAATPILRSQMSIGGV